MVSPGRYSQVQAPIRQVHSNLDQEIIQVTEDKLRLVLNEHISRAEKRLSWIAPLGVALALATTLLTSTFKDVGLKSATWEAVFWLCTAASTVWLAKTAYAALTSPSVADIVEKLKNKSTSNAV
jgi:hypothetical protein